jgi:hypothetical protein
METPKEKDHQLERLMYTSRSTESMGTLALFNLLNQARARNAQLDITGHLLYADGMFTQCIEGPPESIEILWQSILRDPRHDTISLVSRGPTEARRFKEWSMAFSSYRYLNEFNMPGFFPIDEKDESEKTKLCSSQ